MRELLGMSVLLLTVLFGCSPPVEPIGERFGPPARPPLVTAPSATAPLAHAGSTAGYVFDPFAPSATGGAITLGPPLKMRKENVERVTFTPKDDPAELPPILRPLGALIQRLHPHGKAPHFTYDPDNPRRVLDVDLSFQGPIEAKGGARQVRDIRLQRVVQDRDLERLLPFSSIRFLNLQGTDVTDGGLPHLAHLENLRILDLSDTALEGNDLEPLANMHTLEELALGGESFVGEDLDQLGTLSRSQLGMVENDPKKLIQLPRLKKLAITGKFSDEAIDFLFDRHRIETFFLASDSPEFKGDFLTWISVLTNLKHLKLSGKHLVQENFQGLSDCTQLETLDLGDTPFSSASMQHLTGLKNLRRLVLTDRIDDESLRHLAELTELRSLTARESEMNPSSYNPLWGLNHDMTGAGFHYLKELDQLKEFHLTDAVDMVALADLNAMKGLEVIDYRVRLSSPISEMFLNRIEFENHPNLRIMNIRLVSNAPGKVQLPLLSVNDCPELETLKVSTENETLPTPLGAIYLADLPRLKKITCRGPRRERAPEVVTTAHGDDSFRPPSPDRTFFLQKSLRLEGDLGQVEMLDVEIERLPTLHLLAIMDLPRLKTLHLRIRQLSGPHDLLDRLVPKENLKISSLSSFGEEEHFLDSLLSAMPHLEELSLQMAPSQNVPPTALEHLRKLRRLRVVGTPHLAPSGSIDLRLDKECFTVLDSLDELDSVELAHLRIPEGRLQCAPRLRTMRLNGCTVGDLEIEGLQQLERFALTESFFSPRGDATEKKRGGLILKDLNELREVSIDAIGRRAGPTPLAVVECPRVSHLSITSASAEIDRYDLIILGDFPELKELKLQNLVVRQDNLAVLFDAPKLETACFRKSHLEGPDVLWPIHRATSLTDLDLAKTNLTDDQLHRLRRCSSITCLDLSETEIDGSGFDALGGLHNLEALYLKETKVHGEGLEYISQLPELRHLYWPVIAIDRFSLVNRFEWFFDPFFDIGPPLDPDYQGRSVEIAHQPRWHSVKLILKYPVEQIILRDCPRIRTLTIENEVPEQLKTLRKIHISDCRFLLKIVSDTPCREVVLPKNEEENSRRREKIRLEIPTLPETASPAPSSPSPTPAFSPPTTPSTE